MLCIGFLAGGTFSSGALGINDSGQVVGRGSGANGNEAFLWTEDDGMLSLQDLLVDDLGWSALVMAEAINDKGQIVGYGLNASGQTEAFLLTPDGEVPLPAAALLFPLGAGFFFRRRKD